MIQFTCPDCGDSYEVSPNQAGQEAVCTRCEAKFVIPHLPVAPPTASQRSNPEADPSQEVEIKPCPTCGTRSQVERKNLGTTVECPSCLSSYEAVPLHPLPKPKKSSKHSEKRSRRRWDDEDREEDYDDEDYEDRPRRRKRRRNKRPGNITAIAGMLLGGGIYGLMFSLYIALISICLWPGVYFGLVWSIMAIIRGATMLNEKDLSPAPRTLLIMQIIMLVNCDVVNMIMGIVGLVLLNDEAVKDHYERLDAYNQDS